MPDRLSSSRAPETGGVWASWGLLLVFGISGGAALGFQSVWLRMLAAGLGGEPAAMLAVLTAVMAGMGLGAWSLDGVVSRARRPRLWFAAMEGVMAVWGVVMAVGLPAVGEWASHRLGLEPSWGARCWLGLVVPFVVLLPSTAAMGASFPALERGVGSLCPGRGWVGAVYGAQVLGAAFGSLATVWLLMPTCGFRGAGMVLAMVHGACGLGVWLWDRSVFRERRSASRGAETGGRFVWGDVVAGAVRRRWLMVAGFTGCLGMGFEVVGIRLLSQVLANTVYSYAAALAVYLVGTSLGALAYQRLVMRLSSQRDVVVSALLGLLSLSMGVSLLAFRSVGWLAGVVSEGWGLGMGHDMLVTAWVFLVPTCLMGATFSHVAQQLRGLDGGVGSALGMNALGAAVGPLLFGAGLLPIVGARWCLALMGAGYGLLGGWTATGQPMHGNPRGTWVRWLALGCSVSVVLLAGGVPLRMLKLPPGSRLLSYRETVGGFVAVTEEQGGRVLRVDNRFQMGGSAALEAQARQAHVPLLRHERPRRALFLGVGTGGTLRAAEAYEGMEVAGVELLGAVVEAMNAFSSVPVPPAKRSAEHVMVADARRFVSVSKDVYDVIVADLFHPARDGAGLLYTREHFTAVRDRLAPGGLFCQWLPLHQLNAGSLGSVVRTFVEVFPRADLWWLHFSAEVPVVGLLGYQGEAELDWARLERRLREGEAAGISEVRLDDPVRYLGLRALGRDGLDRLAEGQAVSTDDRPLVMFAAPKMRSDVETQARAGMRRIIDLSEDNWVQAVDEDWGGSEERRRRVEAYRRARDVYLLGLLAEVEGREAEAVSAWVESARRSDGFNAGYARCLSRATVLSASQPDEARRLLKALVEARPSMPVARQLLERLDQHGGK